MILSLSRRITRTLIDNSVISFDEFPVYQYGIEVLLLTVSETLGLLLLAGILGLLLESIVFMMAFCTLRVYAGGYHAKTAGRCFTYFVALWGVAMFLAHYLDISQSPVLINAISLIALGMVVKYAPIAVVNRPITDEEYIKFRKYSIIMASTFSALIFIFTIMNIGLWYVGIFSIGMFMEATMLLVEYYREEYQDEKFNS